MANHVRGALAGCSQKARSQGLQIRAACSSAHRLLDVLLREAAGGEADDGENGSVGNEFGWARERLAGIAAEGRVSVSLALVLHRAGVVTRKGYVLLQLLILLRVGHAHGRVGVVALGHRMRTEAD
eukprot:2840203-Prymnesium_polylepis.1